MIVTGVTFAAGVGLLTSLIGLPIWLLGGISFRSLFAATARISVVSCVIGVAFSGLVAITARGRRFDKLSLPHFAALGTGVGLLYFLLMGVGGAFSAWSLSDAIVNFVLLTVTGGGSASAILLLARKGRPRLEAGDEPRRLDEGD
jgi:hypothetical protein